jgi:formate dehydrogenase iron-sulfur subunit
MTQREPELRTLIDDLLDAQRQLTAVERFSRKHESHSLPAQAQYYRDLIPLNRPQAGEQYAFAVNLDTCTGCKACVSACHSLNGLEEEELWRSVGLLHGGTPEQPYQQTVTTACHHCADPACANGCPVLAYEKDEETGIVRHLDDQCIGCQYCVLKCPYEVPQYSKSKGIVRKCDMCHGRLAAGEAPACVQACPNEAISIQIVRTADVLAESSKDARLLPGTFESSYTRPTTRYHTARSMPRNARPADDAALRMEDPHWPLAWMLILTQLAAGLHVVHALVLVTGTAIATYSTVISALAALLAGMGVSFTHLGRPLKAWRAFLGLRRSWMSREIAAFSAYAAIASALILWPTHATLSLGTVAFGLTSVACSAMIYIDTRRPAWAAARTLPRFFGTTALLGATTAAAIFGWTTPAAAPAFAIAATVIRTTLFAWEWTALIRALRNLDSPVHRAALTLTRLQRPVLAFRVLLFAASTVTSLLAIINAAGLAAIWGSIAFLTTTASQVLERHTYFTASAAPRMPGGVPA